MLFWWENFRIRSTFSARKTTYIYSVIFANHSCKTLQQVPKFVYCATWNVSICGGFNENGPPRFLCLKAWSPVNVFEKGYAVWLVGRGVMGWPLRLQKTTIPSMPLIPVSATVFPASCPCHGLPFRNGNHQIYFCQLSWSRCPTTATEKELRHGDQKLPLNLSARNPLISADVPPCGWRTEHVTLWLTCFS